MKNMENMDMLIDENKINVNNDDVFWMFGMISRETKKIGFFTS